MIVSLEISDTNCSRAEEEMQIEKKLKKLTSSSTSTGMGACSARPRCPWHYCSSKPVVVSSAFPPRIPSEVMRVLRGAPLERWDILIHFFAGVPIGHIIALVGSSFTGFARVVRAAILT